MSDTVSSKIFFNRIRKLILVTQKLCASFEVRTDSLKILYMEFLFRTSVIYWLAYLPLNIRFAGSNPSENNGLSYFCGVNFYSNNLQSFKYELM
jgi:hypothetical protein